jgi:hypothetical protein
MSVQVELVGAEELLDRRALPAGREAQPALRSPPGSGQQRRRCASARREPTRCRPPGRPGPATRPRRAPAESLTVGVSSSASAPTLSLGGRVGRLRRGGSHHHTRRQRDEEERASGQKTWIHQGSPGGAQKGEGPARAGHSWAWTRAGRSGEGPAATARGSSVARGPCQVAGRPPRESGVRSGLMSTSSSAGALTVQRQGGGRPDRGRGARRPRRGPRTRRRHGRSRAHPASRSRQTTGCAGASGRRRPRSAGPAQRPRRSRPARQPARSSGYSG